MIVPVHSPARRKFHAQHGEHRGDDRRDTDIDGQQLQMYRRAGRPVAAAATPTASSHIHHSPNTSIGAEQPRRPRAFVEQPQQPARFVGLVSDS